AFDGDFSKVEKIVQIKPEEATPYIKILTNFGEELNVTEETKAKAFEIILRAIDAGFTKETKIEGIIAAAIYLASKITADKETKERVMDRLESVTGIRTKSRYEELVRELGLSWT
ncbi:MAG TPA: hypothetical protein ENG66_08460, partial [Thermococcus sp.]|nr:hypothetical protein [Thermococcus sp.]